MLQGSIVRVVDNGKTYSTAERFVLEHFPEMLSRWYDTFAPSNGECGLLIGTFRHANSIDIVAGVLLVSGVFVLMRTDGLEEVRNAKRSNS